MALEGPLALTGGNEKEQPYLDYALFLKNEAATARKTAAALETASIKKDSKAKDMYEEEVESLTKKANSISENQPKERQALILAYGIVQAKVAEAGGQMSKDKLNKIKTQALTQARQLASAKSPKIELTTKEWNAIQAGAVSKTTLTKLLSKTTTESILRHVGKTSSSLTAAELTRARAFINSGATIAEAAATLGVSPSTLARHLA